MLLEKYLETHNLNLKQFHKHSGFSQATLKNINQRNLAKWNFAVFKALAEVTGKDTNLVVQDLEKLQSTLENNTGTEREKRFSLENRRYIGNKNKLLDWIFSLLKEHTQGDSFIDIFAGTGVVSQRALKHYSHVILNDFLYSNQVIYQAFFGSEAYDQDKLARYVTKFQQLQTNTLDDDYFVTNYGDKFFSEKDARVIGEIRTQIEQALDLTVREKNILLASLIYSADRIANTVGHYDAYRKLAHVPDKFEFILINPLTISDQQQVEIYRQDANILASQVSADIAFVDPPYNSRQYSRFYHVLEVLTKWEKPQLSGVAMKPPAENISSYCKTSAPQVFADLVEKLQVKYIVVTYNNTYTSKSKSSQNKITHEQILAALEKVGNTQVFSQPFAYFNTGKTELTDHKEFVFITKVNQDRKQQSNKATE
ncbi:adenine methyltransferase [Psittacicella hinzii]|uniref:site-specific DNA-methyltransferase (adenine-specific) n=1 Tax=Psittacicella hinzii TaxID=2028575 RepID=A0A3A1Y1I0_9GAMM|nr:DNA adenine methylase [Psittacicella hinzii]RIY31149.1 adenine methyltransferase [Psittacicella hinzii]